MKQEKQQQQQQSARLVPLSVVARQERAPDGTWIKLHVESLGWALLDAATGRLEAPIRLVKVADDAMLAEAIKQLDESLAEQAEPATLVTCGPLHLRQHLLPVAARQRLQLAAHYHQYLDLSRELAPGQQCWSHQPAPPTAGCPTCASINSNNNNNRPAAVDDSKLNAAANETPAASHCCANCSSSASRRLLEAMCSAIKRLLVDEGHKFSRLERIRRQVEVGLCDQSHNDHRVVRARGLPWQATEQDIASFFVGLDISKGGIGLCLSKQGRRNGEAFVRFDSREHRNLALARHKHFMGARYIEVYRASGDEFASVASGYSNKAHNFLSRGAQLILRMRGLPFNCTSRQVVEFFAAGKPEQAAQVLEGEEGVLFVRNQDDKPTGDAFVLFESDAAGQIALSKHKQNIGSRYVELFRSSVSEVQQVLSAPPPAPVSTNTTTTTTTKTQIPNQNQSAPHTKAIVSGRGSPTADTKTDDVSLGNSNASEVNAKLIGAPRPLVGGFTYAQAANFSIITASATRNKCADLGGAAEERKAAEASNGKQSPASIIVDDASSPAATNYQAPASTGEVMSSSSAESTESGGSSDNNSSSEACDQPPPSYATAGQVMAVADGALVNQQPLAAHTQVPPPFATPSPAYCAPMMPSYHHHQHQQHHHYQQQVFAYDQQQYLQHLHYHYVYYVMARRGF